MPSTRSFSIDNVCTNLEKRDQQEERRYRKRQRVNSDEDTGKGGSEAWRDGHSTRKKSTQCSCYGSARVKEAIEHDPTYFKDGPGLTVFVRVENTLFRIHKELFNCSHILQLWIEDHEEEYGTTSEFCPLVLSTPSVDEFRAFLWALYATADELCQLPSSDEDLHRLFNIVEMTLKYDLSKMKTWVSAAILRASKCSSVMDACSSATLSKFVDVAVYHKYDSALKLVVSKWCERLIGKSTPSVPAIQAADKHKEIAADDIKRLKGIAYYVHVQDMLDRQAEGHTDGSATLLRTDPKLNNGQVMRLLGGYLSLVTLWERLRVNPVVLPRAPSCSTGAHVNCVSTWSRRWISVAGWKRILSRNSADVLALLDIMKDQLLNDEETKSGLHCDCKRGGLDEIKRLRTKTEAELAEHFVGCL